MVPQAQPLLTLVLSGASLLSPSPPDAFPTTVIFAASPLFLGVKEGISQSQSAGHLIGTREKPTEQEELCLGLFFPLSFHWPL